MKYQSLLFIQNLNEDENVRKIFDEGSPKELFNYLMDTYSTIINSEYNIEDFRDKPFYGQSDKVFPFGEYDLIVNRKLDYAGIHKKIRRLYND